MAEGLARADDRRDLAGAPAPGSRPIAAIVRANSRSLRAAGHPWRMASFPQAHGHRRIHAGHTRYARKRCGLRRSGGASNPSPFPQVRLVGLGECGTHAIVAARLAAWQVNERALAKELIADFGSGMLVIADRGFYSYRLWQAAAASGADLLWRIQDGPNLPVVRAFPDGSYESFLLDPKVRGRRATQRHRGSARIEEPSG